MSACPQPSLSALPRCFSLALSIEGLALLAPGRSERKPASPAEGSLRKHEFASNPRGMCTCDKMANNPFRIRTSRIIGLEVLWNEHFRENHGGRGLPEEIPEGLCRRAPPRTAANPDPRPRVSLAVIPKRSEGSVVSVCWRRSAGRPLRTAGNPGPRSPRKGPRQSSPASHRPAEAASSRSACRVSAAERPRLPRTAR